MSTLPASRRRGPGTALQYAVESLRAEIVSAELRPGQQVLQEDLAERLGLSVAPVREALRVLEQEGQLTYLPRRGYFVTEFDLADLREIYELRELLEARAARLTLPGIDPEGLRRIERAAAECAAAARGGDVTEELAANRRFHFEILSAAERPHLMRLIRQLWDSTEAYRAIYYNSPTERDAAGAAHDRIVAAIRAADPDRLVAELDSHRARALAVLGEILEAG
jgi:DNA-binding GntR family transcriptional regulator